ncbi:MAG TPA: hypothetical protein VFZ57_08890 [Thermoanaerobaculia bacterium]|nr:hypothetical protein [Thermoanaerobaculia bacterium]
MQEAQRRILAARIIAIVADAVQLGLLPLFAGGALTLVDAALDVAVGVAMVALLGWHWAFLPAFLVELAPALDLAPTWTLAVLIATRRAGWSGAPRPGAPAEPPLLPPAEHR